MSGDRDRVTGRGRDATSVRGDLLWMLDWPRIRGRPFDIAQDRRGAPDAKPRIVDVPGAKDAIVRTPVDGILTIPDAEPIRIPSRAQVSFDGPLNSQPSHTIRRILEAVLN